jgi:zinc transporter ZupT
MVYFNARDILLKIFERNDDFLAYIFNGLLLNAVVFSGCLPVFLWIDCHKFVQYLNKWVEFQVTYANNSLIILNVLLYW